ncbi:MAG: hypothetical protein ACI9OU_001835 [Candidatus Promineifilaceae bacterium]|jgi:hypothetical protein
MPLFESSTVPSRTRVADWTPGSAPLQTRWAADVSPENALPDYPRPQLVRETWLSLNGLWDIALGDDLQTQILVPYPVESALSGVMKAAERMTYCRRFEVPSDWLGQRVLLHFGAVDWEAAVSVNGTALGTHRGGYDAFSFDITDALTADGEQELVVEVFDPTNAGGQARGKQTLTPKSIMYTATSGIWQTVWLEPVPEAHVESLTLVPDLDASCLRVTVAGSGSVDVVVSDDGSPVAQVSGEAGCELTVPIANPKHWSPETPHLYDLEVSLGADGAVGDTVRSYFGMRKVSLGKDAQGVTRLMLNDAYVFQVGPLDQGFWPEGLYTAPTDEALRWDIEETKRLGFNCTRKHVKVEPARWYYWCDRLGLLVWQDMPSVNSYTPDKQPIDAPQFKTELLRMVRQCWNHPSIVMWVVFNESQGQHDTEALVAEVKALDPSRWVSNASGGLDKQCGDVIDIHEYPGPKSPGAEDNRAAVLGEFGGLGLPIEGHRWGERSWGYKGAHSGETLTYGYEKLLSKAWSLSDKEGLSAVIYTQLTDVETEGNGLVTYDRDVVKVVAERVAAVNVGNLPPVPVIEDVVPTSLQEGALWRYCFDQPEDAWSDVDFDDAGWSEGPGGFGAESTPSGVVRTIWIADAIWMRREFAWSAGPRAIPMFAVNHAEGAEIYINGVLACQVEGGVAEYEERDVTREGAAALKPGINLLAVHCKQSAEAAYIDVGIFTETPG